MHCWKGLPLVSTLLVFAAAFQQPAPIAEESRPADAKELFARFAKVRGLEASYEEEKHLALLALPLESSGKLYFLPPGYLTRVVEKPEPSTLRITPDEMRIAGREGVEVIDLRRDERFRVFVTSLVGVFAGQREDLARSYTIVYEPSAADEVHWTLTLTPAREPLDRMMKSLRLHGERMNVLRIEVLEPNGDRTNTRILRANPERSFTDEERERLFGLPPLEKAAEGGPPRR